MECEARHVINLDELRLRRDYLDVVERRRGIGARKALEAVMTIEWAKVKLHQHKG